MSKDFFDICYEILSHYLHFPDVAETWKSVIDTIEQLQDFPKNSLEFEQKRLGIIFFIKKLRDENTFYAYQSTGQVLVQIQSGGTLFDDDIEELRVQLENEIPKLILKGIHQIIKHSHPTISDTNLAEELLQQDKRTLHNYGLTAPIENKGEQAESAACE